MKRFAASPGLGTGSCLKSQPRPFDRPKPGTVLRTALRIFTCVLFLLAGRGTRADPIDWPTMVSTQVITNTFTKPTCITHAGDGSQRLFILSQPGQIWIVRSNAALPLPFLNITNRVITTGAEQGLLGLAFPGNFSTTGHFYVDYTRQSDGAIVISRFFLTATNTDLADTNSEQIILVIPKPAPVTTYNNHNGGQLAFGPDGYLYIGVGDGGSEGDPKLNGQNTTNFFGKILRIDVENGVTPYAIPPGNPFVNSNGYAPEIWAYGLRNPWKFSFDRLTGDLYIGDVGQYRFEEIDYQPAGSPGGQNYGWRIMEGTNNYSVPAGFTNFSSLTRPVACYDHFLIPADGGGCVIGGSVYRGPDQPRMNGAYFYADFSVGWICGLKRTGTNWQSQPLYSITPPTLLTNISTLGEDDLGNLYWADYGRGKIYQIQDSQQAWLPTFLPASGTLSSNSVIVNCLTPGATIHYTSNTVDPTISDPSVLPGQVISVASGTTNKIRAFRADLNPSAVASAVFALKVATPIFTPSQTPVPYGTPVGISTVTPGATIYFTTNGTVPTTNSAIYSSPIQFDHVTTINALGSRTGFSDSTVATVTFPVVSFEKYVVTTLAGNATAGLKDGLGGLASFSNPKGITIDAGGNLYVADTGNNVIRMILPSGLVTTIAGNGIGGLQDGMGTNSQFSGPTGLCSDGYGGIAVADTGNACYPIRKIDPAYDVTTFLEMNSTCYGSPVFWQLKKGMDQNLYLGYWATVRKISPDGTVTTLAGSGADGYQGWSANVGLDIDSATNVYAATENKIWKIAPDGTAILYAGSTSGFSDGDRSVALFQSPQDAVVDPGTNIFVSDYFRIRKIRSDGWVSTVAGTGSSGYKNGAGSVSQFNGSAGMCRDTNGNLFVTDSGNNCIRKISPDTAGIGIPDDWQIAHFGHVGIDPNADPDHDGMSNYNEFWAGTDPNNAGSCLSIDRSTLINNGHVQIRWQTVPGKIYVVQTSMDLATWNQLGSSQVGDGTMAAVSDPTSMPTNSRLYYRISIIGF